MQIFRRPLFLSALALFSAAPFSGAGHPVEASPLTAEIFFAWADSAFEPPVDEVQITLESAGHATREVSSRIPGRLKASLASGLWQIEIHAPELWASGRFEVEAAGNGSQSAAPLNISIYPATKIETRLLSPVGSEPPSTARFFFQATPHAEGLRKGEGRCLVSSEGLLKCKTPRGIFDFRFELPGFAPIYRWDIEATESLSWKPIELLQGASLSGWISAPATDAKLEETSIELTESLAAPELEGLESQRATFRKPAADATPQGFFQLTGLRPGLYTLIAKNPAYAPTVVEGIRIDESEETSLEPLELQQAAELTLTLEPATDPFRQPWHVELSQADENLDLGQKPIEGTSQADGSWSAKGLAPGLYDITASDSRGTRWLVEQVSLFASENSHFLKAPFERLEGLVVLGDEPVAGAEITLKQHRGNMHAKSRTRHDGRFFVFLKEDLLWTVEVTQRNEKIQAQFHEVEVPPREPMDRWPKRIFEIPDNRLFGDVINEDGTKNTDPTVIFVGSVDKDPSISLSQLKPVDGFEFRGIEPGRYRVSAAFDESSTRKRGQSQPHEIMLEADGEIGPLQLQIEESQRLDGQIVDGGGTPLPAARVFAETESHAGQSLGPFIPSAFSQSDGVFELDLPKNVERILLSVLAPGYSLQQIRYDLRARPPLLIVLNSASGSLFINYQAEKLGQIGELRRRTFLIHDERIRSGILNVWAQMHPEPDPRDEVDWLVPALPPGSYRACLRNHEIEPYLAAVAPLPPALIEQACGSTGYLTAGSELHLTIPEGAIETLRLRR